MPADMCHLALLPNSTICHVGVPVFLTNSCIIKAYGAKPGAYKEAGCVTPICFCSGSVEEIWQELKPALQNLHTPTAQQVTPFLLILPSFGHTHEAESCNASQPGLMFLCVSPYTHICHSHKTHPHLSPQDKPISVTPTTCILISHTYVCNLAAHPHLSTPDAPTCTPSHLPHVWRAL